MNVKYICDIENDLVILEVWECVCGFHLGIDASFLEQVGNAKLNCPSCKAKLEIESF